MVEEPQKPPAEDADALFHLLSQIVPLFYQLDGELPGAWIARIKASMRSLCPQFTATRMVRQYFERYESNSQA